jgi:biofilm PGA synthesis lipoprotein PgaB
LFHDDGILGDDEDASDLAMRVYADEWGLPQSIPEIRQDPVLARRWSEKKSAALNAFTLELAAKLREYRPSLLTARNIFAGPVLDSAAETSFSQSYTSFLRDYDYTVVMAMPFMENAENATDWLKQLEEKVAQAPNGFARTVFELQSKDWRTNKPVPGETLADQIQFLQRRGARHFGYYPDDFLRDEPPIKLLRPVMSLESNPAGR